MLHDIKLALSQPDEIPYNKPCLGGMEQAYIAQALAQDHLAGDGPFSKRCEAWLEEKIFCHKALLTPSCTAALEMAAMLIGTQPGDEIIMPSFTFVSTANAFLLRGGVPVFVDIHPDTLCIDEGQIERAITPRTRAIVVVHYAGVACDMDAIMAIAARHGLIVIEDAAHAILSSYKGRPLGSIGHLAALSFHESKNITCGEGGALLINDPGYVRQAQIIQQKGTNRVQFNEGVVDKYSWHALGSSYLMSEITAAFLLAQLEQAESITARRLDAWQQYREAFRAHSLVQQPFVPAYAKHNAHIYFVLMPTVAARNPMIGYLKSHGISAHFHYVPLHQSQAGQRYGRAHGELPVTEDASARILRLPLWAGLDGQAGRIAMLIRQGLERL